MKKSTDRKLTAATRVAAASGCLLLAGLWFAPTLSAAEPPAAISATVTKVAVFRHHLSFQPNGDTLSRPPDDYLKFVEEVKAKDVVGVHLIYGPSLTLSLGNPAVDVRRARLLAAYRPLRTWLTERQLDVSVFDIGMSDVPFTELAFDAVVVEVVSKRR